MAGKPIQRSTLGAFSSDRSIRTCDKRSAEAVFIRKQAETLIEHLGGRDKITAPQEMLVRHASVLEFRLRCIADRYMANDDHPDTLDERYRLLLATQHKLLVSLGLERPTAAPMSFQRYLEAKRAG